jgi:hypothetical protein
MLVRISYLKDIHARWPSKDLPEERREREYTKGRVLCVVFCVLGSVRGRWNDWQSRTLLIDEFESRFADGESWGSRARTNTDTDVE